MSRQAPCREAFEINAPTFAPQFDPRWYSANASVNPSQSRVCDVKTTQSVTQRVDPPAACAKVQAGEQRLRRTQPYPFCDRIIETVCSYT